MVPRGRRNILQSDAIKSLGRNEGRRQRREKKDKEPGKATPLGGRRGGGTYLLAELHVHRLAVAANTVQHPRLDAAAAHGAGTQLTGAPLWGGGAEFRESTHTTEEATGHRGELETSGNLWRVRGQTAAPLDLGDPSQPPPPTHSSYLKQIFSFNKTA